MTDKAIITKLDQNIKPIEHGTPSISLEQLLRSTNLVCRLITRSTTKNGKLGTNGAWPRSRDLLLNSGTPSISPERLKVQISNLVCRMTTRSTTEKCKRRGRGTTEPKTENTWSKSTTDGEKQLNRSER